MANVIGIDIGGSTTKITGFNNGAIYSPMLVKATDPIASVYGAFGKFLNANHLSISDIDKVMVTGVGSSYITKNLYGVSTAKVDEFLCVGTGGLYLSNLEKAIVVSMGTGTAFISADHDIMTHIGGSGVGGGTLLGLSSIMLNVRAFDDLIKTVENGSLNNIDLTIGDISQSKVTGLTAEATASNFGKISDLASHADIGMGIINLVFQTIGMLSVFATKINGIRDIVLTGNLVNVPQSRQIFDGLKDLFNVEFHMPHNAEYATSVGAAIAYIKNMNYVNIE